MVVDIIEDGRTMDEISLKMIGIAKLVAAALCCVSRILQFLLNKSSWSFEILQLRCLLPPPTEARFKLIQILGETCGWRNVDHGRRRHQRHRGEVCKNLWRFKHRCHLPHRWLTFNLRRHAVGFILLFKFSHIEPRQQNFGDFGCFQARWNSVKWKARRIKLGEILGRS